MKETFRASMAWLHTWAGLLLGWVLYFMFVTGTAGYLDTEIDRWMQPELPLVAQAEEHTRQSIRAVGNDPLQRLLAASDAAFSRMGKDDGDDPYEDSRGLVWLACWGVSPWVPEMKSLQAKLWRRYRHWIERTMIQAADERGVKVDARRASIMYSELINGLWIGWMLDNDAYTPEMAAGIVRDWVLDLFGEERSSRKLAGNGGKPASAKTKLKTPKANSNGRKVSSRKS